jgi:tetratricopeptide (TPR) repeat protein
MTSLLTHFGGLCSRLFLPALLLLSPRLTSAATPQELLAAGRVDEVIPILKQQIASHPNDAESHNFLCRAYYMLEEWDRGIEACERARNLDPQKSLYSLWLGRIYGLKADHVGAFSALGPAKKFRSSLEHAVELDPRNWEARSDLAEFYLEAPGLVGGGRDKARTEADEILPLNPARAHWVKAKIAEKEKDSATAEREYRAAIPASHSGVRAWFDLAYFLFHAGRLDEMEQAMRTIEASPLDHPESLPDAASVLLRSGRDYPLAIRLLRRYLAAPVEEAPAFKAHDMLGQLLEKQGDRKAAAEEFRASLALSHTYARAQEDLKRVNH